MDVQPSGSADSSFDDTLRYLCTYDEVPYCLKFFSKADGDEDTLEDLLTEYLDECILSSFPWLSDTTVCGSLAPQTYEPRSFWSFLYLSKELTGATTRKERGWLDPVRYLWIQGSVPYSLLQGYWSLQRASMGRTPTCLTQMDIHINHQTWGPVPSTLHPFTSRTRDSQLRRGGGNRDRPLRAAEAAIGPLYGGIVASCY